jgi:RNA polymerase sigma-70 factor (family 1)
LGTSSEHTKKETEDFKLIFDAYYHSIRSFIYFKTGDSNLADDLVQEVFLKVWNMREKINYETVRALLYTIAGNLVKNHYTRKKVEYNFQLQTVNPGSAEPADFDIQSEEFNQLLQKTLAGIPEKSRIVFLMNRIDKLTYPEIADSLGLSVKAVEKRMNIALQYIRKRIQNKF